MHIALDARILARSQHPLSRTLSAALSLLAENPGGHEYTAFVPESITIGEQAGAVKYVRTSAEPFSMAEQWSFASAVASAKADLLWCCGSGPVVSRPPTVLYIPDMAEHLYPDPSVGSLSRRRYAWVLSTVARGSLRVYVPTDSVAREVEETIAPGLDRTVVLPLGVNTEELLSPLTPAQQLSVSKIVGEQEYLLLVTDGSDRSGVHGFLDAYLPMLARDTSRPLLVVNCLSGEDIKAREMVVAAGLTERVRFTESVDRSETLALIKCARGLCQPSLYEGYADSAQDALFLGIPTLVSDRPYSDGLSGPIVKVNPLSPISLTEGIDRLLALEKGSPRPLMISERYGEVLASKIRASGELRMRP